MTKWHAHVVHMVKHMNMVGGPCLVGCPGSGPLGPLQIWRWFISRQEVTTD